METLLFVAFELLELQKVTLVVFKDNEMAYYLYKKYLLRKWELSTTKEEKF
jgi:hypothetical protein